MNVCKLFVLVIFLLPISLFGQEFLNKQDLSLIKADQFSEAELVQISKELKANNMTLEQAEPLAIAKGMPASEFTKLKARMQGLPQVEDAVKVDAPEVAATNGNTQALAKKNIVIYGAELFTSKSLSFEPNPNMPTPLQYVLGPTDQIEIVMYGLQQLSISTAVTKNGTITIPNIAEIFVSGLTFEAAQVRIKSQMAKIYTTLSGNQSKLSFSVSRYRSILITIIGAQQSGNYNLSALSTVFNALHVAGGPNDYGSFRKIELIRNNKVIRVIDLYQFLTQGNQSDNVGLQDNDVIRIPSYDARVVLEGEVKNQGIYEVLPGETLAQVIHYASGFTDIAYKNRILVKQKTTNELKIKDLNANTYAAYTPASGDIILVDKILTRYENRIQIKGAVYRPGEYSLSPGESLTVKDLIAKADGLVENVFLPKASLIRQEDDLTTSYINIQLMEALQGNPECNIRLQKEDILMIFYNQELLDRYTNSIDGEVREPGTFPFSKGKSLYDLLLESGYFTDKASGKVVVYRKRQDVDYDPAKTQKVFSFELEIDLKNPERAATFLLEPMDHVVVNRIPTYEVPQMVILEGEVLYPGQYALLDKQENYQDLIIRSGGFTTEADISAIRVKRNDLVIALDWPLNRNSIYSKDRLILLPGDSLFIPKKKQTISVIGNVMFETEVIYKKGNSLKYYLQNSGGLSEKAWKKKIYVLYSNGKSDVVKSFLGFKMYPQVKEGSKIIVPQSPEREGLKSADVVAISTAISTLLTVFLFIFR